MGCVPSKTGKGGPINGQQAQVATDKVLDIETKRNIAFWKRIRDDAFRVLDDLKNEGDTSNYVIEYQELLERFCKLYNVFGGNIPKYRFSIKGDANVVPFPLPSYLPGQTLSTRPWMKKWVKFDLQLSPEGAWHMLPEYGSPITPLTTEQIYRSWYTGNTFRCGAFYGESAWDVLPVGVIKNDITTPEQDIILLKRSQRKDLYDKERMKSRRQELMHYFIKTYDTLNFDHEKHLKFAQALEDLRRWMAKISTALSKINYDLVRQILALLLFFCIHFVIF